MNYRYDLLGVEQYASDHSYSLVLLDSKNSDHCLPLTLWVTYMPDVDWVALDTLAPAAVINELAAQGLWQRAPEPTVRSNNGRVTYQVMTLNIDAIFGLKDYVQSYSAQEC